MKCVICKKEFIPHRSDAIYCSTNCRSTAYRDRLQLAARSTRQQERDIKRAESQREAEDERQRKHAERLAAASSARSAHRPRIPLEDQIGSQAPSGAFSYRLVLGIGEYSAPDYAPSSYQSWSLRPFAPPNDPRLQEGRTYRIVWLDQNGQELSPSAADPAPALYYFLGNADGEVSSEQMMLRQMARTTAELRSFVQHLEGQVRQAQEEGESLRRKLEKQKKAKRRVKQQLKQMAAQKGPSLWARLDLWMWGAILTLIVYMLRRDEFAQYRADVLDFLRRIRRAAAERKLYSWLSTSASRLYQSFLDALMGLLGTFGGRNQSEASSSGAAPEEAGEASSQTGAPEPGPQPEKPRSAESSSSPPSPLQPILPVAASVPLLAELCDVPQKDTTNPSPRSDLEAQHPLAYVLVRSVPSPNSDKPASSSAWALLWDAHRAATGLAQLGRQIRPPEAALATFKGHPVTADGQALAMAASFAKQQVHGYLSFVDKIGEVNKLALKGLRPVLTFFEAALQDYRPAPDDVLALVLYDALLSIRSLLKSARQEALGALAPSMPKGGEDSRRTNPFAEAVLKNLLALGKDLAKTRPGQAATPSRNAESVIVIRKTKPEDGPLFDVEKKVPSAPTAPSVWPPNAMATQQSINLNRAGPPSDFLTVAPEALRGDALRAEEPAYGALPMRQVPMPWGPPGELFQCGMPWAPPPPPDQHIYIAAPAPNR